MDLKNELKFELTNNILPYWINKMLDRENGGFYGRIDGNEVLHRKANKGAILNARLLWTFAAAYRILKKTEYLTMAERAYKYLIDHFIDRKNGGIFWELDYLGKPVNTKKQTYAQGFALYGLSEFYRATGNREALEEAKNLFYVIEKHCYDPKYEGYFEAFTVDWQPIDDMRLSEKDANEKKTMNTHLHILEPYTNLFRVWNNEQLKEAQTKLINVFVKFIVNQETNHLDLFFDEQWNRKSSIVSFGHDIEASWLLFEAAEVLGNVELFEKIKKLSLKIADVVFEGLQQDGSLIYETDLSAALQPDRVETANINMERHWWVQAEAVTGLMYAWTNSGNKIYLENALRVWNYIRNHIIDHTNGEWFWSRLPNGQINKLDDKAGFWKCPYHNGRMCMEIITLLPEINIEQHGES